jgi:hypothetical protein
MRRIKKFLIITLGVPHMENIAQIINGKLSHMESAY